MLNVLLVDDSSDDLEWVESMLREGNPGAYHVVRARRLDEAFAIADSQRIDLVITDFHLTDGTGVELAEGLRRLPTMPPVIVITGLEFPDRGREVLYRGAAEFMSKDELTPKALARCCGHAIVRGHLEREAHVERERMVQLQRFTSALGAVSQVVDVANVAMANVAIMANAAAASFHSVDRETLTLRGAHGFSPEELAPWSTALVVERSPQAAVVRDRAVRLLDAGAMQREYGIALDESCTWLAIPLESEGDVVGVVGLRFAAVQTPAGKELEFVLLLTSVLAQALRRARLYEAARASAEIEERMLAVLGHDLRGSLNVISMAASVLPPDPIVERIERSAKRMTNLIDDIVSRAEVRRGGIARAQPIEDLARVVEEQIDELRAGAPQRQIDVQMELASPFPCLRVRVSQIITNLVRNAIQHGAIDRPVRVRVGQVTDDAFLSVHNHGPIIPAASITGLLEPFARGVDSKGSGLGLFIVHETVTSLGGKLVVESGELGTMFTITLPPLTAGAHA